MKKIPTLFKREFEGHKIVGITDEITPGCEEAFFNGIATEKFDGSCCAIIDNKFYKRYDARKGKTPPPGAIPCCDPDPVTGHWPHWVLVDWKNPADQWFVEAFINTDEEPCSNGTYEAIGPHFNGDPYSLPSDRLIRHGCVEVNVPRNFDGVRNWLKHNHHEGLVFWLDGEPVCKIKRTDFGFTWPAF
jgi:hypothetical protein